MPVHVEGESAEQTAALCLRLFFALGIKDISMTDIDITHRVPAREALNKPNAIICKLTSIFFYRIRPQKNAISVRKFLFCA